MLHVLACAWRPLSTEELIDAMAVDLQSNLGFDTQERLSAQKVLSLCPSLIATINETEEALMAKPAIQQIKLCHPSVKEFLLSQQRIVLHGNSYALGWAYANATMASICLSYLLTFNLKNSLNQQTTLQYPLAKYAARYWTHHFNNSGSSRNSYQWHLARLFCNDETFRNTYWNSIRLFDPENPLLRPELDRGNNTIGLPLYHASATGCVELVKFLLQNGADVNAFGGRNCGTALHAACVYGHPHVVDILLDNGADINSVDGAYSDKVYWAAFSYSEMVLWTPLITVAFLGKEGIVEQLLGRGADPNIAQTSGYTALHFAVIRGHTGVVRRLLQHSANVNALVNPGYPYGTESALIMSVWRRDEQAFEALLERNPDMTVRHPKYGTALDLASKLGLRSMAEKLSGTSSG